MPYICNAPTKLYGLRQFSGFDEHVLFFSFQIVSGQHRLFEIADCLNGSRKKVCFCKISQKKQTSTYTISFSFPSALPTSSPSSELQCVHKWVPVFSLSLSHFSSPSLALSSFLISLSSLLIILPLSHTLSLCISLFSPIRSAHGSLQVWALL